MYFFDSTCKQYPTEICVCLTYFDYNNALRVRPQSCKRQNFVLLMAEQYSSVCVCVCVWNTFFIHSYLYTHLDCFHIQAIVNKAAMNTGMHVCFQISVSAIFELVFLLFPDIPRSRDSGAYGSSIFSFWETSICFPQWLHQFRFAPSECANVLFSPTISVHKYSLFSTSSPTWLLDGNHFNRC